MFAAYTFIRVGSSQNKKYSHEFGRISTEVSEVRFSKSDMGGASPKSVRVVPSTVEKQFR